MEMFGRSSGSSGSQSDQSPEWGADTGLEDSMRRFRMWGGPDRAPGLFPERPGFPDCSFYMRTGSCAYGPKCRYNHPRDRALVRAVLRFGGGGEPPERPGEPACEFYLRTGTCKFGASCKFHHPRNGEGYTKVRVNSNGFPLRLGEPECSYYLKTGQCKFGIACKFHHPQPNGMSMPAASARPFYPSVQMPSAPSPHQYGGSAMGYRAGRPSPLLPGSYVPHQYGPVLVPPGVVPIPSWNTYSGSPTMSPNAQPTVAAGSQYVVPQLTSSAPAFAGPYHTFSSSSLGPSSSSQRGNVFPVRPSQPDCKFYLKTGDCKFGSSCRFNHPLDWVVSKENCAISPLGLPLRPGVQPCSFYMLNNHCKFGRMCKFDHPMGTVRYSPSASSLTEVPVTPYMVGSPLATLAPSFSYAGFRPELSPGSKSESYPNRGLSSGNTSTSSVGLIFQQTMPALLSNVQFSSQTPLNINISTRPGGEF